MAKKKTAPATKTAAAKKPAAKKTVAAPAPPLTDEQIGLTAGLVWQALSEGGDQTAAALKKAVEAPGDLVMAAVGWLAREEKLHFANTGRTVKISLKQGT